MNRDLKPEEHESIDLNQALQLIDRYLARAGEKFDTGEEALAATMFGFSRSPSEFIEICVNGPTQISYKFEVSRPEEPWYRKLFSGVFRYEQELHSREELIEKIREFFTTPSPEIKRRLEKK